MRRLLLALSLSLGCLRAQEGWHAMPGIGHTPASWRAQDVSLAAEGEQLIVAHDANGNGFALPRSARFRRELSVNAVVTMRKRLLGKSGWNFAGVTLFQDTANFWLLALVEGPAGKHSVDFIECHAGTWQAQSAAGKALKGEGSASYGWQTGAAYHLRLAFQGDKVRATVSDASGKTQLSAAFFELGKGPVVRAGMPGLIIRGSEAGFTGMQVKAPNQPATQTGIKLMNGTLGRIALFDEPLPGPDQQATAQVPLPITNRQANQHLSEVLKGAGFGVTHLSADQIAQEGLLSAANFHILVIPNCASFPAHAGDAVLQFAREGGHLIFIGGPFLDNPTYRIGNQWLDKAGLAKVMRGINTAHHPLGSDRMVSVADWARACKNRETKSEFRVVREGPGNADCLRLDIGDYQGWDGFVSPDLTGLFAEGHNLLTFLGKGDARTSQVAVEVQEQDGSRWIATAELSTTWQRTSLGIADFHYWPDSPTKKTRGQAADRLNPSQAARLNFGLASTHTPAIGGGAHTVWIADLGTAKNPFAGSPTGKPELSGTIPTIHPRYKVHPISQPASARDTRFLPDPLSYLRKLHPQPHLVCGIPRTLGTGFDRDHKWRFVPLAKATSVGNAAVSGICEWLVLNQDIPLDGVAIAALGYNDPRIWSSRGSLKRVAAIAKLMRQGAMLEEAGTEHFAYWPGEKVRLGLRLHSFAHAAAKGDVKIVVREGDHVVWKAQTSPNLPPGRSKLEFVWEPPLKPAVYTFRVTFGGAEGSPSPDSIEHEFAVLDPNPAPKSEFITVRDGDFWLKGKKWYPVGINYWPLYVAGMDRGDYWAGWMRDRYYEPTLVEQDLVQMADMGINMVSIQSPPVGECRNLLDFARRCANHGIWINLYNGLASPLAFNDAGLKEFLETSRIPDNPIIFAYDTIWEPGNYVFKDDGTRGRWDGEWRAWLDERYGSVENAEKDWRYKARRNDQGEVISPPNNHFREDGDWRGMMAAYRRFMDDLTSRLWGKAHRRLRELDPNHLISYRQGNTLAHDFALSGTSKHIDFICPEGYAVPHSDAGENAIGFITRYVDYTTAGKPVIWSEYGKSVWNNQRHAPNADAIKMVGEYHARFYRAALESGANGTAPWWWPGGYRVGERSDFGIVEPDRTERPAALLIREYAPKFKRPRPRPVPTAWLDYDRDAHAGGYWRTCFHEGADAYRAAADQGKTLGIRTKGTGTDSTNTPLIAIGNVRCNGLNPPKFLNAEFNHLQILAADGTWIEATNGAKIQVKPGQPVHARASLGNLQEATWAVPGGKAGGVALVTRAAGKLLATQPIAKPVPHLGDADFGDFLLLPTLTAPTALTVRLEALERTPFGEARAFTLLPVTN